MARYRAAYLEHLPGADQLDCELFPQTRNLQAVPDYACEIYHHMRSLELSSPHLYT
jgi:hypothetical protein